MITKSRLLNREVNHIVQRTMLGDCDNDRLVVSCSVNARQTVHATGETVRNISSDYPVNRTAVHTLEERETGWVQWRDLVDRVELLNNNVGVSDNVALCVNPKRKKITQSIKPSLQTLQEKPSKLTVAAPNNNYSAHSQSYPSQGS